MSGSELLFYAFAAVAVVSALGTITRRNPIVAAIWLVATFFCVAVCYILLSATFLAAIQVLVYAGAIMVLFVFVIMVLDVDEKGREEHRRGPRTGNLYKLAVTVLSAFVVWILLGTLARQFIQSGAELPAQTDFGTATAMGRELFRDYLFAFEAISLLLLAAVVGAVVVARTRKEREREAARVGLHDAALDAAGLSREVQRYARGPTPATDFGAPSAGGHTGGA